ncbi:MAG: efflux transporter outer membrane subunit [Sphingomonadales bacterium]|nr:efflux transporter outer membrane subunit [Sphingomonadales bacterium]
MAKFRKFPPGRFAAPPPRLAGLVLPMALAACVPGNGPLPAPHSTAVASAAAQSVPGTAGAAWPSFQRNDAWWHALGDPQLDRLIDEGLAGSPDVAAAVARFRKAAALSGQARGALLPSLDAQGAVSENRISTNQGYPDQFKAFLPTGWNDSGQLAAAFNFEPDIWGRARAQLRAATSEQEAARVEAQAARLALASGITEAYVDLSGLLTTRDLRKAALASRESTRALVADRQAHGLETLSSLRLAETQAALASQDLAAAEQAVLLRRHQLAALLGQGPDRGLAIATPTLAPINPAPLPETATTELVARRPDLIAARARLEAAASRVHAARAAFFPAIRLSALYGVQSLGLNLLFDKDSQFGNATAAFSLPIFHGGALKAQYGGARADYEAAVAAYDKAVVGAYQQLADAVTSREALARRNADGKRALDAAEDGLRIARLRYGAGLANYLEVLTAENQAVAARLGKTQTDAGYRAADIALIRALGGGYSQTPETPESGKPPHE